MQNCDSTFICMGVFYFHKNFLVVSNSRKSDEEKKMEVQSYGKIKT